MTKTSLLFYDREVFMAKDIKAGVLGTIWEVPDDLWADMSVILETLYPPAATGRPRNDLRLAVDGIIYRMRSGCQWNQLPKRFGSDTTVHGWFQQWNEDDVFKTLWAMLILDCEEMGDVDWEWQSVDGCMNKTRFGGEVAIGPNPTDRAKAGVKKSIAVEATGGPTSVVIAGANVHDTKLLEVTIGGIVVDRPDPKIVEQNICLDKGYDNPTGHIAAKQAGYVAHIRRIGEEKLDAKGNKNRPARRWVVERTLAWLQKCRAILIRYDKKDANYLGLIQLACALIWYRRKHRLQSQIGVSG